MDSIVMFEAFDTKYNRLFESLADVSKAFFPDDDDWCGLDETYVWDVVHDEFPMETYRDSLDTAALGFIRALTMPVIALWSDILGAPQGHWGVARTRMSPASARHVAKEYYMCLLPRIKDVFHELLQAAYIKRCHRQTRKFIRASRKIQEAWRRAIADPTYLMCQQRLMREARELIQLEP